MATAAATTLPLRGVEARGLVGSQLFGWGQYYQREGKKLNDHLEDVLSALRDAGYHYAEHSLGNADASERFADLSRERGLQPVCVYTGGNFHDAAAAEKNVKELLTRAVGAKEAGFRIINCNPNPIGRNKTDEELATQAKWLNAFGAELASIGLKLGVHNHTPEMANGAKEFHYNFRKTDPGVVGFCYDVHWVYRGGVQPADALAEYADRIVSWHLRQSREKVWWEDLDSGDVDYQFIADFSRKHRLAPIYTVELALEGGTKITRSVVENHARSRDFVKQVFGV
jgi:inosose dehydratase